MLESIPEHPLSKEDFAAQESALRVDLLNAQFDLQHEDYPLLIFLAGNDSIAMHEQVRLLYEWMDGRHIRTHAFPYELTEEERLHPTNWRLWRGLPTAGQTAIYLGSPAFRDLGRRLRGDIGEKEWRRGLRWARRFERTQRDGGALVLKFWLQIPRDALERRIKKSRKGGRRSWEVTPLDREILERYDEVVKRSEEFLEATDGEVPWHVVSTADEEGAQHFVVRTILEALGARLTSAGEAPAATPRRDDVPERLRQVDLRRSVEEDRYKQRLDELQRRLRGLSIEAREKKVRSVLVFEGWDAAGKGGTIRRLTRAMSPRDFEVISVAAPTDEEAAHHYLWRFWRHVPGQPQTVIFDRSWYGRVLVERVEGLAAPEEWQRAYDEINDFEEQLTEHGIVVQKFWLHIDANEQLRRFEAREKTSYKKYKITTEDYRNRGKWDDYVDAVNEMIVRTDARHAPWFVVPAIDKKYARLKVLKKFKRALKRRLS